MRDVYVAGVGMTPFGKFAAASLRSLGRASVLAALEDAGLSPRDIEVIACGSARSGMLQSRESGVGQLVGWELGIREVPVYNVKAYCSSGSTALNVAYMAVAGGFHDVALVVGVEKMSGRPEHGRPITADGMELKAILGSRHRRSSPPRRDVTCGSTERRAISWRWWPLRTAQWPR